MAAASAATVEFGPQILWLDKELLQVLAAGNKVLLEELLRGEGGTHPARTNGQVAISFHGTSEPAARRGTSRLLGVTSNGSTALHVVASHGHAELAALICERAPSLAATRNRSLDTPLHCASKAGHRDVAACLLRVMDQATPRSRNLTGATALHEAVRHGHVEVVDLLMTTDPWLASVTTNGGVSPLYMAVSHSVQMVQALLRPSQDGGPSPASAAGPEGCTALHVAAIKRTNAFTVPGGFIADDRPHAGTAILASRFAFRAFVVTDTMAFLCSIVATSFLIYGSAKEIPRGHRWWYSLLASGLVPWGAQFLIGTFALGFHLVLGSANRGLVIFVYMVSSAAVLFCFPGIWGPFCLGLWKTIWRRAGWRGLINIHDRPSSLLEFLESLFTGPLMDIRRTLFPVLISVTFVVAIALDIVMPRQ
ncbi:uncharacterized protein LOC127780272 [Oryza glaberrima]|nr:uncharacterized protein LOC127780272 [Oryza glaberrima]